MIQVGVIHDVSALDLGPVIAKSALFEQMLASDFVLGVDEHAKDGFIVGVHLEALVGESTSNSLLEAEHESKIELRVIVDKSFTPD